MKDLRGGQADECSDPSRREAQGVYGPAAGPAEVDEGPKTYNVELTNFGDNKIKVIKVVRELTGLGLKEAKDLVEAAPTMFKENVDEATANDLKGKLEEAGAVVTLK